MHAAARHCADVVRLFVLHNISHEAGAARASAGADSANASRRHGGRRGGPPVASAARPFNFPGKYVEFDGAAAADKFAAAAAAAADQEAPSSYRLMQHARRTQRCCSFAAIIKSATRIPAGRRIPL